MKFQICAICMFAKMHATYAICMLHTLYVCYIRYVHVRYMHAITFMRHMRYVTCNIYQKTKISRTPFRTQRHFQDCKWLGCSIYQWQRETTSKISFIIMLNLSVLLDFLLDILFFCFQPGGDFNESDINALKDQIRRDDKFQGVDILLTSVWPQGITKYTKTEVCIFRLCY